MDQFNALKVQNKLRDFYKASGEKWMVSVAPEYAGSLVFQRWLDDYYDQYIKEKDQPLFQVPRYQPDQEYDSSAVKEYSRDAKLKEIVTNFWNNYKTLKKVLDSDSQNVSALEGQ